MLCQDAFMTDLLKLMFTCRTLYQYLDQWVWSVCYCVGTVQLDCTHRDITKKMKFYITDVVDDKLILGLDFSKTFQLISVHCDSNCPCKANVKSLYEVEFPIGLSVPSDEK